MTLSRYAILLMLGSSFVCCASRGRSSGGGDDDDNAGDDDATADDDAAGDDDVSTGEETLACDSGAADVWSLNLSSGDEVLTRVDTIAAATTFDPAFTIYQGSSVATGNQIGTADDEFPCTFPPVQYECPEYYGVVEVSGPYIAVVRAVGQCAGATAAYSIEVFVNGDPRSPTLALDEKPAAP